MYVMNIYSRSCCNTVSESGGDLRGQQDAETSPTAKARLPRLQTQKDDGFSDCLQDAAGDPGAASAQLARRRLRPEGAEAAPLQG